jgi:predicted Fe-Mo cluster-binding NifX family protein
MIVAIASEEGNVAQHFGHCEGFYIYNIQNDNIVDKTFMANPGHQPGLLPALLNERNANVVIAGGMGSGAIELFNANQIDVITGASGDVENTLWKYLSGSLVSSGSICHEHQHAGSCNGH